MAYCPACRKQVEEKWIECPFCRREVIHERGFLGDRKRAVENPLPLKKTRTEFDLYNRVKCILLFRPEVFEDIAMSQPVGEAIPLYAISLLISLSISSTSACSDYITNSVSWIAENQVLVVTSNIFFSILTFLLGVAIAHVIIRMLEGKSDLMATLTTMLYVNAVWSIVMTPAVFITIGLSLLFSSLGMQSIAQILGLLPGSIMNLAFMAIIILESITALSIVHNTSKIISGLGVVASYGIQFALGCGAELISRAAVVITRLTHI